MKIRMFTVAEWIAAILLTVAVLILLFARAQHAGGLWRDECASVQLAEMPTVGDLFKNFQRESFPAFFPLIVRAYSATFGTSAFGDPSRLIIGVWVTLFVDWRKVTERQTNLDLVAQKLERAAQLRDLIVFNPWFY